MLTERVAASVTVIKGKAYVMEENGAYANSEKKFWDNSLLRKIGKNPLIGK